MVWETLASRPSATCRSFAARRGPSGCGVTSKSGGYPVATWTTWRRRVASIWS